MKDAFKNGFGLALGLYCGTIVGVAINYLLVQNKHENEKPDEMKKEEEVH